jgi:hypothetical protein
MADKTTIKTPQLAGMRTVIRFFREGKATGFHVVFSAIGSESAFQNRVNEWG